MGRKPKSSRLKVCLNGLHVGVLSKKSNGIIEFQYEPSWLEWDHAIPISLSMPLQENHFVGEKVIAYFDNLLPDQDAVRRVLAEKTGADGIDVYSLLSAIGKDCVGALQFVPENLEVKPSEKPQGFECKDEDIENLLKGLHQNPLGIMEDDVFRISIAGAQEKTALLLLNNKWHRPEGMTATTHILKPVIGKMPNGMDLSDSIENEYFCLRLANELGFEVAKPDIIQFGQTKALVIERFDRLWTKDNRLLRLPQEDCCQALSIPSSKKYQQHGGPDIGSILELLSASDRPKEDRETFLKAQMFFWLLGATDGHAKNFSIHLLPKGQFHLTPLYDILSSQPYFDRREIQKNKMKMAMSIGKNKHYTVHTILLRHFIQTAEESGITPDIVEMLYADMMSNFPKALDSILNSLPPQFPYELAESIADGMWQRLKTK